MAVGPSHMLVGWTLALGAAVTNTAVDSCRKHAASIIPVEGLVALVGVADAAISWLVVAVVSALGGFKGLNKNMHLSSPYAFFAVTFLSSTLLLTAKVMYQKALQLSPLSLTIPYLSFTPAILVITAYFLLGEEPSASGLVGVAVVALGGYLLSLKNSSSSSATPASKQEYPVLGSEGQSAAAQRLTDGLEHASMGSEGGCSTSSSAGGATLGSKAQNRAVSTPNLQDAEAGNMISVQAHAGSSGTADASGSLSRPRVKQRRAVSGSTDWAWFLKRMGAEPGTVLMLLVAGIFAFTASLDKLGTVYGSNVFTYFALQRAVIGSVCILYLLLMRRDLIRFFASRYNCMLIVCISVFELLTVVLFLSAVQHILVSYVVAIKRCNILLSVIVGRVWFRESIASRLPYVFLMLLGMSLIVLEPSASTFHHTHTRHLHTD